MGGHVIFGQHVRLFPRGQRTRLADKTRELFGQQQEILNVRHAQGRRNHDRSEEHTSELQSRGHLVCRLLLEKKKKPRLSYETAKMLPAISKSTVRRLQA